MKLYAMCKKFKLFFITLLCFIEIVYSDEGCIDLQFSISQSVENEGFHRDINWLIESLVEAGPTASCRLSLQLDIPSGVFVNPDQIYDLVRKNKLLARVDNNVNIETPAHESEGHVVNVYAPGKFKDKILIQLPIHLRYHRASITGGYTKVKLPKPLLLVLCPKEVNLCNGSPIVKAPCDVNLNDMCYWKNITYEPLFEEVTLFVPIGNLDDYPLVSIVTLLLGCAGSIYILSLLSSASI